MIHKIRDPRMRVSVIAAIFAMGVLALAFTWRAHDQEKFRQLARSNCEQIEELKEEFRNEAIRNFDLFDRNAGLLGIEPTPKLRAVAQQDRDRTLVRFAPREC